MEKLISKITETYDGISEFTAGFFGQIPKSVLMGIAVVLGLLLSFALFISEENLLAFDFKPATDKLMAKKDISQQLTVNKLTGKDISQLSLSDLQQNSLKKEDLALANEPVSIDSIEENINDATAVSMQATAVADSKLGRQEPFDPLFGKITPNDSELPGIPGMPGGEVAKPPSAAELAKQKAEERRGEIRDILNNNIGLKGIVLNTNHTNPMAVIEFDRGDGSKEVKTLLPGDEFYLNGYRVKINKIDQNKVSLKSEDIQVDRYLPEFDDDTTPTSASTSAPEASLASPPGPGTAPAPPKPGASSKSTTADDAKKKIEEIDKLLDSF